MTSPSPTDAASRVVERARDADDRVAYVERALLAAQLGTTVHDLELLPDDVVTTLLDRPSAVVQTIGATRLLAQLDALESRRHPVHIEYHGPITAAEVPIDDGDDSVRLVLEDGVIHVTGDVTWLTVDETEAIAHALLRLVWVNRQEKRETDR